MEEILLFTYIKSLVEKIKSSEKGQGMVEYALIIAFVAAIAIFALNGGLRDAVSGAFESASTMVEEANTQAENLANEN